MGSLDRESGSGSRKTKNDPQHKHRKKFINFIFWSAGCSFLRAEGFSCSLDISKFQLYFFSSVFGHQNPGSGLDPDPDPDSLEMLDRDPYPNLDSMNSDPQLGGTVIWSFGLHSLYGIMDCVSLWIPLLRLSCLLVLSCHPSFGLKIFWTPPFMFFSSVISRTSTPWPPVS